MERLDQSVYLLTGEEIILQQQLLKHRENDRVETLLLQAGSTLRLFLAVPLNYVPI